MNPAATSAATRNNGPGGDSAADASTLTTLDPILDSSATECACQPVVSMMAVMVVPFGRLNSATTAACLDLRVL
jgi:hypothetical protein